MFPVLSLTVHLYLPASDAATFGMTSRDELTPKARLVIVWFSISHKYCASIRLDMHRKVTVRDLSEMLMSTLQGCLIIAKVTSEIQIDQCTIFTFYRFICLQFIKFIWYPQTQTVPTK